MGKDLFSHCSTDTPLGIKVEPAIETTGQNMYLLDVGSVSTGRFCGLGDTIHITKLTIVFPELIPTNLMM